MSNFTTLNLSNERVLVKGTDSQGTTGETVVFAHEWNEIKRRTQVSKAHVDFDDAVEKFFAPLLEAAEKLGVEHDSTQQDEASFVVLDEGVEATAGRQRNVVMLSHDSIVLRLLEEGQDDRLIWVNDSLEVLEVLPGTSGVAPAQSNVDPHHNEADADSVSVG